MLNKPFSILLGLLFLCQIQLKGQEIGLQLYSLRNELAADAAGTLSKIKEMGIREIEMTETYGLSFPQFIKLLAINNLTVISYGTSFEQLQSSPQAVADQARSYGARYVVVYWLPHAEKFSAADVESTSEILNQAGKILAQNGLLLCYHPHGYEFTSYENGTLFDYLVRKVDNRYVYFQLDVFWAKQGGQDPAALLKKYPTRFVMLHLKDRKAGSPNSADGKADIESNVVLGTGDVNIAEVMRVARELGIQHYFIEDESSRAMTQIPESINYLKTLSHHTRK